MNTTSTKKSTLRAELLVMLLICLLGIFGAFSLVKGKKTDGKWTQTETQETRVAFDAQSTPMILDN